MLLLALFLVSGFVLRRWIVVLLPVPVLVVHYVGRPRGWWGDPEPHGELSALFLVLLIVFCSLVVAAGVLLRKAVDGRRRET